MAEKIVNNGAPYSQALESATNAVLKPSAPVPDGILKVSGIEFRDYKGRDITAAEMVSGMTGMGFQASAISDAARVINDMVGLETIKAEKQTDCSVAKLASSRHECKNDCIPGIHL